MSRILRCSSRNVSVNCSASMVFLPCSEDGGQPPPSLGSTKGSFRRATEFGDFASSLLLALNMPWFRRFQHSYSWRSSIGELREADAKESKWARRIHTGRVLELEPYD